MKRILLFIALIGVTLICNFTKSQSYKSTALVDTVKVSQSPMGIYSAEMKSTSISDEGEKLIGEEQVLIVGINEYLRVYADIFTEFYQHKGQDWSWHCYIRFDDHTSCKCLVSIKKRYVHILYPEDETHSLRNIETVEVTADDSDIYLFRISNLRPDSIQNLSKNKIIKL